MGAAQLVTDSLLITFEVLFCILSQFKDILVNLQCSNLFLSSHIPTYFEQKLAIYLNFQRLTLHPINHVTLSLACYSTVLSGGCKFCNYHILVQFPLFKHILDVSGDS